MSNRDDFYTLKEVADKYSLTINELIRCALKDYIELAVYIDLKNVSNLEPCPFDTIDVPIFNSGLYYVSKKDVVKFLFSNNECITINNIYPESSSCLDDDFLSPYSEDDTSSYPKSEWNGNGDKPLLCLIVNDYTIHINDLVILAQDIEFLDYYCKTKYSKTQQCHTALSATAVYHDDTDCDDTGNESDVYEKLLAEKGLKFSEGCRKRRTDNLWRALSCVVESYRTKHPETNRLPFDNIIKTMRQLKETNDFVRSIIIEIDKEAKNVAWKRQDGSETTTGFKRINDRLAYYRKILTSDR